MADVKRTLELSWKEHPVDLEAFLTAAKAAAASCCGLSADVNLRVHFTDDDQAQLDAVSALWAECDDAENAMCASYKSQADLEAAKAVQKQSAINKLKALGLTDAEVAALSS